MNAAQKIVIINTIGAISLFAIPVQAESCIYPAKTNSSCDGEKHCAYVGAVFNGLEGICVDKKIDYKTTAPFTNKPVAQNPCYETLEPRKPAETPKPPTGYSAGFSAGDQIPCHISEKGQKYQTCLNESDPQGKGGVWITNIRELLLLRQKIASKCAAAQKMTIAEASKEVSTCLKASIIDSIWNFVTHRK